MQSQIVRHSDAKRVLVLTSGITNYFYDVVGKRLGEAFQTLGWHVALQSVPEYQPAEYDLVIFTNISDIIGSYAKWRRLTDFHSAVQFVKAVKGRARNAVVVLLEPVRSEWFAQACSWCHATGVLSLYDLGFHDQRQHIPLPLNGITYHFMLSGLNMLEQQAVRAWQGLHKPRPLPWAFVGLANIKRILFVRAVAQRYLPNGFVYMPHLDHITHNGRHIDGKRLQIVLEATRYYLWISQDDTYFYLESERFRNAAMAGCVPIKVQDTSQLPLPKNVPFAQFILPFESFEETLKTANYEALRTAFLEEYLGLPTLESEISRVMLSQLN